jgi:ferredoxin
MGHWRCRLGGCVTVDEKGDRCVAPAAHCETCVTVCNAAADGRRGRRNA